MHENILVAGATGKVGSELVRRLRDAGARVRAGTRSPDRARELFGEGVEVVELDYHRADTYDGAVHWADRLFVVPAPFDPDHYDTLIPFLDWAVQSGTEHLVLQSAMAVERVDDLHLHKVERHVQETGVDWTFLRPNWFMQNFSEGYVRESVRREGSFALPAGRAAVSFVDARDVAEVAAAVLTTDDHVGAAYTLTGPRALDHFEAADVLSEVAGRPVAYREVADDDFRELLRERGRRGPEADVIVRAYRSMRDGWRVEATESVAELLGRQPTGFRAFAEEHAEAWAE